MTLNGACFVNTRTCKSKFCLIKWNSSLLANRTKLTFGLAKQHSHLLGNSTISELVFPINTSESVAEMLHPLRYPRGVMAATWDLSAETKMESISGCDTTKCVSTSEQTLDLKTNHSHQVLFGPFRANQLAVSEKTNLGLSQELFSINYKQPSQNNSSLASSMKRRSPKVFWGTLHIHTLHVPSGHIWDVSTSHLCFSIMQYEHCFWSWFSLAYRCPPWIRNLQWSKRAVQSQQWCQM